jgi:hypothetical protein
MDCIKEAQPKFLSPHNARGTGQCFIDHITPLECRGADAPFNMQWQTIADGKAKVHARGKLP